jgi:hypothetical protein
MAMKKIIYFAFAALLFPACEPENIEPALAGETSLPETAKQNTCSNYPGWNEVPSNGYLLVGFDPGITTAMKTQILRGFVPYDSLETDYLQESGPVSPIVLKPGTTCSEVNKMLANLKRRPQVKWAYPVFDDWDPNVIPPPGMYYTLWHGLTNEFYVEIADPANYQDLLALVQATNTQIVTTYSDTGFLLSADKRATGNTFQVCDIFRQSSAVLYADPNLLMQLGYGGDRQIRIVKQAMKKPTNIQ